MTACARLFLNGPLSATGLVHSGVDLFWGVVVIAAPCSQGLSWRAAVSFLFVL
jgi:hypothetical protein